MTSLLIYNQVFQLKNQVKKGDKNGNQLSGYDYDVQLPLFQLQRDILNQLSMVYFCYWNTFFFEKQNLSQQ